uniref:Enriched in surface-labeled proteome protein 11 n=1 Tax=Trypanosoma congolense (strain IL3000) TaxID=1068625 RepID=G0ULD6_TRYCI|nr:conserved hypothetical protein [Trypanosoma congolense IL3000]
MLLIRVCLFYLLASIHLNADGFFGIKSERRCRALKNLQGINKDLLDPRNYSKSDELFCSSTAPQQFRCFCGVASTCLELKDPWGGDIGKCGCCPPWLILFYAFFLLIGFCAVISTAYICFCRGKWWFDGYPPPVIPAACRRAPPIVAAAAAPLPPTLFRGYQSSDFTSVATAPHSPVSGSRRQREETTYTWNDQVSYYDT